MSIYGLDPTIGIGDQEFGVDELLHSENDSTIYFESDCSSSRLFMSEPLSDIAQAYPEFSTAFPAYST